MKKVSKSRLLIVLLIALVLIVGCVVWVLLPGEGASGSGATTDAPTLGSTASTTIPTTGATTGSTDPSVPASIADALPDYTYAGNFVDLYDMGADGWYYTKKSKVDTEKNIDPLLNGKPIVDDLGGGLMYVYSKATKSGFTDYRGDLEKAGYRLYAENDLGGNLFATYINSDYVVTLSYLPNVKRQLCILIEPMRALPGLKEENVYEDLGIQSSVTVVTCSFIGNPNGQCIIYQLCDGSFILSDAGYGYGYHPGGSKGDGYADYWQNQAHEIYNTLMTLLPEGQEKPVIAGWFFSHPHWDHIGGLSVFAEHYGDDVIVEKIILNHPNRETIQQLWRTNATINITYVRLMQEAAAKFEGVSMIEAHAGQTYYIRNAEIDILCTWELQTECSDTWVSVNEGNSASVVLDLKIEGERMILFGDCGASENLLMQQMYIGDFLKADFVQPAHHGYNDLRVLYGRIDADVAIWPEKNAVSMDSHNAVLADLDIYAHGEGITYIPLPYAGDGSKTIWDGTSPIHESKKVLYWDAVYPIFGKN